MDETIEESIITTEASKRKEQFVDGSGKYDGDKETHFLYSIFFQTKSGDYKETTLKENKNQHEFC